MKTFAREGKREDMHDDLEQQMVRISNEKDRRAFANVYEYYAPRVKSYLLKMTLAEQQADDLSQEVMLIVWRKAHLYDPKKARLSTWLFRIARNKYIDSIRGQKYQEVDASDHLANMPSDDRTDQPIIVLEESDRVRAALNSLKNDFRIVLEKSFMEEKSHSEIAAELGLPLGTVKSRIRIGFQKMRRSLGEREA